MTALTGKGKVLCFILRERNLGTSYFIEFNLSRNIYMHLKDFFTYGLTDFPRKDNTLFRSKLASYFFKQI